ncbi:MAG TPA: flagellin [Gammaproteobacteria bacterium]|nr:flagellin [Gammaproteobacteria bacterium]
MPQIINTNMMSLNSQRQLDSSQGALKTSLQRLSSGLRINSAKDDAAGLAISERFTSQIRGLDQAVRNANDGISLAQTAEGALAEYGNMLQRVRELGVQSANDTNSASDREALNNEVSQLLNEMGRIASSTEFNGQKILDGSLDSLSFQVGANRGQTITVTGNDARTAELGAAVNEGVAVNGDDLAGLAGTASIKGEVIDLSNASTMSEVISAINGASGDTGVTASQATSVTTGELAYTSGANGELTLNGTKINLDNVSAPDAIAAINAETSSTGVTAEAGATANTIVLSSSSDITAEAATVDLLGFGTDEDTFHAGIELSGDLGDTFTVGGNDQGALGFTGITAGDTTDYKLSEVSVDTADNANDAMRTIDFALSQVNGFRSQLGAVQNRFESTISNLSTTSENLQAARSRIRDADFAAETAELTRTQILQQAGTSMLAQANQIPQNVLSLLQ